MNDSPASLHPRGRGRKIWSGTRHVIACGMPPLGWRDPYHRALTLIRYAPGARRANGPGALS